MKTSAIATAATVKTILFATDFSPSAERAQGYAEGLAARFRAKLIVVHAKQPPNYALPPDSWRSTDDASAMEMEKVKKSILNSVAGIDSEFHTGEGTAWQVVDTVAAKTKIDLIIVGTRGRTGVGKALLGSRAEEIFRHASCPVLTVGPNSQQMGNVEETLAEVLYATDFSQESQAAARYAISFALGLQAHLTLLHVIEKPKVGEVVHAQDLVASSARLLRGLVPDGAEFWRAPQCLVEEGEPAEKIQEIAERTYAGLIVLGVRKPIGISGAATHLAAGVAHKIVVNARCPVLTVRG
jgi:nucleotide-binding universal stress UspA family protein